MNTAAYHKYQQNTVQTATPGQLLIMLFDGAIRFVRAGIEGINQKDLMKTNTNLTKAQSIVHELIASLDMNYPVSESLASLYEYMHHQLVQANIQKDVQAAEEVLGYLTEFRETWFEANKIVLSQKAGGQYG